MGWFYSLGIIFPTLSEAERCKAIFENNQIVLSDSTIVQSRFYVEKLTWCEDYILSIYPEGFSVPNTDKKLFMRPYFYEVRKHFYDFLGQLKMDFNLAWWEIEAADRIKEENILLDIQERLVGDIPNGDFNAKYFSELAPESNYYKLKK